MAQAYKVMVVVDPESIFIAGVVTTLLVCNVVPEGFFWKTCKSLMAHATTALSYFSLKRPDYRSLRSRQLDLHEPDTVVRTTALSMDCSFGDVRGLANVANDLYDIINDDKKADAIDTMTRISKTMFEEDEFLSVSYYYAVSRLSPGHSFFNGTLTPSVTRIELEYIDSYGCIRNKIWGAGKNDRVAFPSTLGAFDSNVPKLGSAVISITYLADSSTTEELIDDEEEEEDMEEEEDSGDDDEDTSNEDEDEEEDPDYIPEDEEEDDEDEDDSSSDETNCEDDPFALDNTPLIAHAITPPPSSSPFGFFDFMLYNRNKVTSDENTVVSAVVLPVSPIDVDPNLNSVPVMSTDENEEVAENEEEKEEELTPKTPGLYDEDSQGDEDESEVILEADISTICRSWVEDKKRKSELRSILPFILRDAIDCGAITNLDVDVVINVKLALRYTDGSEVVIEIDRKGWVYQKKKEEEENE